jgi:hypothetical protein
MKSYLRALLGMTAAALFGLSAVTAWAGDLGLVENGDMETVNRFSPWGDPDDGDPNTPFLGSTPTGRPDAWHHSADDVPAVWSDPTSFYGGPHPTTSGIHALWLEDSLVSKEAESRSYAGDSTCCGGDFTGTRTGNLPLVGSAGRILTVGWEWDWDITNDPNQVFTGTVRISKIAGTGLDLTDGGDPNNITEHFFFTGTGSSGGYASFSADIPLDAADAQFDIIFNTGDRTAGDFTGRLNATGTLFVDDVSAVLPEPASLLLLSISGLMVMARRQRG